MPLAVSLLSRPLLATLLLALVAGAAVAGWSLARIATGAAEADPAEVVPALLAAGRPRVALVLGMGPSPARPILDRADLAVLLWRQGVVDRFVTSGGQGSDEGEPEAVTLANALTAAGVPAEKILTEAASTSTRENFALSRPLLENAGWWGAPVVVVTHGYHAQRAGEIARAAGFDARVAGADGPRLDRKAMRWVREVASYLKWRLTAA